MTIARSEDISKEETSKLNLFKKKFSFRKHYGTVLTEEIRIAKFCTEVLVMSKHLITKLNIPESSLGTSILLPIHVSTPCNRFIPTILHNYCDIVKYCSFCTLT